MPDRFQESHIRQVPIFNQLPGQQFQWIVQAFQARRYNAGDRVLIQSTPVPGLIIVVDGQLREVQIADDGTIVKDGAVYPGQPIYQQAMFEPMRASAHLQAITPTTILLLSRDAMADLLSHHPQLRMPFGLGKNTKDHHIFDVQFKTQRANEEILLKTRRHWFSMMRWMWVPIVFMIVGFVLAAIVTQLAVIIVPPVFLLGGVGILYIVMEWANDSVIITDQRVIRITHTILTFSEVRDEVKLESIQEANAQIPTFDIFARIFKYGDVQLKTAGAEGNFVIPFMPDPDGMQNLIIEDARRYKSRQQNREREEMVAEVDRWINEDQSAGQQPFQSKAKPTGVSEESIKNIYTAGEGPLSPFVTSFLTQDGGMVYRKHWWVWLRGIASAAIWLLLSIIAMVVLATTSLGQLGLIGWVLGFVAFLVSVVWFWWVDWDWRHDYYLITDNNITIVNQRPLWLQDESDQVLLKQVDNVVAETKGILQQLFKFGDVRVALVGADTYKLFDDVANPVAVQSEITRRQQRMKQRQAAEEERRQRETIGEYISLYHQRQGEDDSQTAAELYQRGAQEQTIPSPQFPQVNNPTSPQTPASRPAQSPFGSQRPSISSGRPYMPASQPPPQQPLPYNPNQYPAASQPGQGQYQQNPQYPQQGQQNPQYPQQGQQYPQQGQQNSQQPQYPQQGQPQQGQNPPPPPNVPYQQGQNPPPPPNVPYQQGQNPPPPPNSPYPQQRQSNQRPPEPPPFRPNPNN